MYKDYLLLAIVTLMSVAANLPDRLLGLGLLDRKLLVIGLLLVVSIALIRYSKLALVLAVVILAIGANLPQELAVSLNVEPRVLMFTLFAIVLFALANRLLKLPSGLDRQQGFDGAGTQALFGAVVKGRTQVARQLLGAGIDVNARSTRGYTALMLAAARGQDEIVALLLENGADLTMIDPQGRNALQYARSAGKQNCIALLLAAGKAEINRPGTLAAA